MPRLIKKRARRSGLPPGSLVYIGDQTPTPSRIRLVQFDNDEYLENEIQNIEDCKPFLDNKQKVTWIHIEGVSNEGLVESIGKLFGINNFILEDVLDTDHRPKIEEHADCFFALLKLIQLESKRGLPPLKSEQISFIHSNNYVLSIQETQNPLFDSIVNRVKKSKGRVRHSNADYLLAVLMDAVVDQYFFVIEHIGERIEEIENEVADDPKRSTLKKINLFRNELIFLKKIHRLSLVHFHLRCVPNPSLFSL